MTGLLYPVVACIRVQFLEYIQVCMQLNPKIEHTDYQVRLL